MEDDRPSARFKSIFWNPQQTCCTYTIFHVTLSSSIQLIWAPDPRVWNTRGTVVASLLTTHIAEMMSMNHHRNFATLNWTKWHYGGRRKKEVELLTIVKIVKIFRKNKMDQVKHYFVRLRSMLSNTFSFFQWLLGNGYIGCPNTCLRAGMWFCIVYQGLL
jgi:hypothetical protein